MGNFKDRSKESHSARKNLCQPSVTATRSSVYEMSKGFEEQDQDACPVTSLLSSVPASQKGCAVHSASWGPCGLGHVWSSLWAPFYSVWGPGGG